MKRTLLFSALILLLPCVRAQGLSVVGTVVNGVDGNGLPLCVVRLFADGRSVARAVSDYAGNYSIPSVPAGCYDIMVVQFGDTLSLYRNLTIMHDTRIRHVVWPPTGELPEPTVDYSLGIRLLRPVTLCGRGCNMLDEMGLLINNPNDPRLWDFSGQMDPFEDLELSFWWSKYKLFYKLKAMGYQITSPFELMYPEIHHPASDSTAHRYRIWILGLKF